MNPQQENKFLLKINKIKKKNYKNKLLITISNAVSTLVLSNAEVSIKANYSFSAYSAAISYLTALKCLKSLLLPTNIITIFSSALDFNSANHLTILSNVYYLFFF